MHYIKNKIILAFVNHIFEGVRFFRLKRFLLRCCGVKIGKKTKIVGPIKFSCGINITIGDNCWIGKNLSLDGNGEIIIGNNCDIAPHVIFSTGGHLIGDETRRAGAGVKNKIVVENGTWIGTRSLLVNNLKINSGSVIAAGSVVISDQPANTLVAGVPAQVKKEFKKEVDNKIDRVDNVRA